MLDRLLISIFARWFEYFYSYSPAPTFGRKSVCPGSRCSVRSQRVL